jgi:crotonobetainyl-CoA:carnitine CoA-transferase CaiB-like acyl-CoA transferase
MRVAGPHLPYLEQLVIATGLGKRSAHIDLRKRSGLDQLMTLVQSGDIFCQAYRPGSLASRSFSPENLAAVRPGIVYVTLSAYGHIGPWHTWRGYDSLVQSTSGIAYEGGRAAGLDRPKHLPCQALDFGSGYLAAFGAMVALKRRAEEGGSWLVRVSLAQTAYWLDSLGRVDGMNIADPTPESHARFFDTQPSPFGEVSFVKPAGILSETPARWELPPVPLGTHPSKWDREGTMTQL